jgi:PAS domain S-box-containing protein
VETPSSAPTAKADTPVASEHPLVAEPKIHIEPPYYKDIVEGSPHGIIVHQDGCIVYANSAMAKLFGYATPEEMIGLSPFEDLVDADELSEFRARTAAAYRNEKVSTHPGWKARRRDHQTVWIASTAHKTEWQGRPAVASSYFDITDLRKAELGLRESEARYRAALGAGQMGAWETDLIDKTRIWTPEGMALFGFFLPGGIGCVGGDRDEYIAAIHPEDRHLVASFYKQAETADGFPAEYRIVRPDGTLLWLSGRGQVVSRTSDGRAQRLISIMGDISERKANEQRVQSLMRELAHRTGNLIAVVQAIARTIGRSSSSLKEFHLQFEARLQALATSHQVLARQSWAAASLQDLIREQLQPFVPDKNSVLELTGPETHLSVEVAQTVGLAIHELATNALKHGAWSVPNGKVSVDWKMESSDTDSACLILTWREQGGPLAAPSSRKGFGHVVLYDLVPQTLQGSTKGEFLAEGFRWTMSIASSKLAN